MHLTEDEVLIAHQQNIYLVDNMLKKNKISLEDVEDIVAGMLHFHDQHSGQLIKASASTCRFFDMSEEALLALPAQDYFARFFDPQTVATEHPKLFEFYARSDANATIGIFERVRRNEKSDYQWFLDIGKISQSLQASVMVTYDVKSMESHAVRLSKLLDQNQFLRKHYQQFSTLTERERNIVQRVARGERRRDIADALSITVYTLDTHRRNIRAKLETCLVADWIKYADAFGLLEE